MYEKRDIYTHVHLRGMMRVFGRYHLTTDRRMKAKRRKRLRLYGKRRPRMPKPPMADNDKGFTLRMIREADSRFAVVKQMRERLERLIDDCQFETVAEESLCGRAVFFSRLLGIARSGGNGR